jgi:dienelactone hydrolase
MCTDYPSYGVSEGYVSEGSMKELALDTYDTAIQWDFVDTSNITVIGYSIGTGPASYLAAHRDLASLVLLAPYDDFWDNRSNYNEMIAQKRGKPGKFQLAFERVFYGALCGYNLDPLHYANSIEEPTLIICSPEDTTIFPEASMRVADRIENCEVANLPGIKHEELLCDTSYETIKHFYISDQSESV